MSETKPTKKELEARVNQLEHQVQQPKTGHGGRKFLAAVLILLTVVVMSTAIKAFWLRNTLFDTTTFTNKATAIIQTSSVRTDLSNKIVTTVFEKVDVQKYVSEALPRQGQPLVGPITSAMQSFTTDQVTKALESQQFVDFWKKAVASAHSGIIKSLDELNNRSQASAQDQVIYIDHDQVMLNIGPIINQVKSKLSDAGLGFVNNLNTDNLNVRITIATVSNLPIILAVFNGINAVAFWLPILVLIVAAGAIAVSTNRRRALIALGVTAVVIFVIDIVTLRAAGTIFAQELTSNAPAVSAQSAQSIYQILTNDLLGYFQAAIWLSFIVIAFALLAGLSKWAVWVRQHIANLFNGEMNLPAFQWLAKNAYVVVGALVGISAVVVILAPFSSAGFALWTAVIIGIVCILILSLKLAHATKTKRKSPKKH
jgi:hypothetical protein